MIISRLKTHYTLQLSWPSSLQDMQLQTIKMADVCPFVISPVTVDPSNPRQGAIKLLGTLRPHWKQENTQVEVLSGGSVNTSVLCYLEDDTGIENGIVLRCYGDFFGQHICRQREFMVMQVAHHARCSSPVFAVFKNGMAYGYAPGRHLTTADLVDKSTSKKISHALAQFHSVEPNTVPLWNRDGQRIDHVDMKPSVLQMLQGMVREIPDCVDHDAEKNARFQEHKMSAHALLDEIAFINDIVNALSPVTCTAHCDFHLRNVLYDESSGRISLLDFELSQPGLAALDINQMLHQRLMIEALGHAGPDDVHVTEEAKAHFMRCYLQRRFQLLGKDSDDISDKELSLFFQEQNIFRLIFFLFWIIVPHNLANRSELSIDVFRFVPIFKRMYFELKETLPQLIKTYLDMKNNQ